MLDVVAAQRAWLAVVDHQQPVLTWNQAGGLELEVGLVPHFEFNDHFAGFDGGFTAPQRAIFVGVMVIAPDFFRSIRSWSSMAWSRAFSLATGLRANTNVVSRARKRSMLSVRSSGASSPRSEAAATDTAEMSVVRPLWLTIR
ncbi:hypothetical protein [Pseudomonas inefficax]|uniref:hypothetical protein n=1 Tax=Pseudomonas inefficax TaxID=2078786 RepID=UPI002DB79B7D|nr:hypothetical protein [Pseudomonas sp. CMAA1741]MEC4561987.1 hypothetical protein [Pseudomonas sp. CMAA1741]